MLEDRPIELGREGDLILDDPQASRRHAVVEPHDGGFRVRDLKSRNRTHVDGAAVESARLQHGSVLRLGGSLVIYAERELDPGLGPLVPTGPVSLARQAAEALIDLAAPRGLPILILGPTGAGKELLAQRVHQKSGRAGALIPLNCSTLSRELVGSELFGHAAGAFSGAQSARTGLFAAADKGTLFLDEIAELPLEQQPALLRALQEGKVRPVGADREQSVDVRVVAATLVDLPARVASGQFRADLHARLAGLVVELPGLQERKEEILALFASFLGPKAPALTLDAAEALLLHPWPQNIRELKHVAERINLYGERLPAIDLTALPPAMRALAQELSSEEESAPTETQLVALLTEYEGNVAQIARALGRHRQQVYRWLERYGLDATKFRAPSG